MLVDGPKAHCIELAFHRGLDQLNDSTRGGFRFELGQDVRITNSAQILKNVRSGIQVRVRTLGHAAPRSPLPSVRGSTRRQRSVDRWTAPHRPAQVLPGGPKPEPAAPGPVALPALVLLS